MMGACPLGIQTGWAIGGRKHAAVVDTVQDTAQMIASAGGSRHCDNSENLQLEAAAVVVVFPMNRNQSEQART